MPTSKDIQQIDDRTRAVETRVISLESDLRAIKKVGYISLPLLAGAVSAALAWCLSISNNLAKINQNLSDHGSPIVTQLQSPSSPLQLQASFLNVAAAAQIAKQKGDIPNAKTLAVSRQVAHALEEHPTFEEGWQAAAELISFRGGGKAATLPLCLGLPMAPQAPTTSKLGDPNLVHRAILLDGCTFNLDDARYLAQFKRDDLVMSARVEMASAYPTGLILQNVHVIYKGGQIIEVPWITFINCTFEFQITSPPPDKARQSITTLLAAENLSATHIGTPSA